jgi:Na+-transporting methylmalonyl-CoA/oxaloacetate decarboxylase gamma subunit
MTDKLLISLEILWKGMAGTFIVSLIVIVMVKLLSKLVRDKPKEI